MKIENLNFKFRNYNKRFSLVADIKQAREHWLCVELKTINYYEIRLSDGSGNPAKGVSGSVLSLKELQVWVKQNCKIKSVKRKIIPIFDMLNYKEIIK